MATTNGISTELLSDTVQGIREHPEAGTVRVRTRHRWDDAFGIDGWVESFEDGSGDLDDRRHRFRTDWPEPFGRDSGPTPGAESILAAVGSCVATTYIVKAAAAGVPIDELEVTVSGQVDLQGLFEVGDVRPGFRGVSIEVKVHSSAEDAVLSELGRTVLRTSPACDVLANPVPLDLSVERQR